MTRQEIRDRILVTLNDSTTAPVFWSLQEVNDLITEAQEVLAEEARALRRTAYIPRTPHGQFYTIHGIADDVMVPFRLWLPDKEHRLRPLTMGRIDKQRQRWLDVTGNQAEYWFPVSWDAFGIYPPPTTGGGYLQVDYLAWPPAMLDDDEEPQSPEPDHDMLVLYGVYMGLIRQWDIVRATEMLGRFVAGWLDAQARQDVRRMHARFERREEPQRRENALGLWQ